VDADQDEVSLGIAPEGAVPPGAGAEDDLVVQRCDCGADERTNPEDPLQQEQPTQMCELLLQSWTMCVGTRQIEICDTWSLQALLLLYTTAAPRLLAGLIPVPVIGIVARCTMNTANPIGSGANTW